MTDRFSFFFSFVGCCCCCRDDRNQALYKYGFAIVDGHIEKVGNYNMEPPGTFRGRGQHPKMGKLKSRVLPEQVSINLSEW